MFAFLSFDTDDFFLELFIFLYHGRKFLFAHLFDFLKGARMEDNNI